MKGDILAGNFEFESYFKSEAKQHKLLRIHVLKCLFILLVLRTRVRHDMFSFTCSLAHRMFPSR